MAAALEYCFWKVPREHYLAEQIATEGRGIVSEQEFRDLLHMTSTKKNYATVNAIKLVMVVAGSFGFTSFQNELYPKLVALRRMISRKALKAAGRRKQPGKTGNVKKVSMKNTTGFLSVQLVVIHRMTGMKKLGQHTIFTNAPFVEKPNTGQKRLNSRMAGAVGRQAYRMKFRNETVDRHL